ncbi:arylamine N-acetyltransferase [Streptomyces sp. NPDC048603]|uniref:arylamine N-acetyltransferase family protein n=1 Tax=Streptomyces sp. NPDC048603 TaxID=3365577 RepID=UPI0037215369
MSTENLTPGRRRAYLDRIGYDGPLTADLDVLRALCRAHVRAVPFELLDGPDGIRPGIDVPSVFDKVVRRRQGGACMEVNRLFAALLADLGHEVTTLASRPWLPQDRAFTDTGDHMVLLVRLDGTDWLVDVAYSQLTAVEPLELDGTVRTENGWEFRVLREDAEYTVQRRGASGRWAPVHRFTLEPRGDEHFDTICDLYLDPSNASPIPRTLMCARTTEDGKVTLVNDLLIETLAGGAERSARVSTPEDAHAALARVFDGHPALAERGARIWQRLVGDRPATPTPEETPA